MDAFSGLSDGQLAVLARRGNDAALAELIARYLPGVFSFIARMTGADAAEDLAQETFVKAWKNLKRFDESRSFKAWAYAIAKNTAYDWLRKHHAAALSSFEDSEGNNPVADSLSSKEPLPDERAMLGENAALVQKTVARLPILYRAVIVLRYEEGLSFEEISAALGRPLETVRSQHRRGLDQLRDLLEELAPDGGPDAYH